jgi:hypothetical protein
VPYRPPWSSLSSFASTGLQTSRKADSKFVETGISSAQNLARLYPNVRGCGYPPDLNCEEFFEKFGGLKNASVPSSPLPFTCWVSTIDSSIAMTELDLVNFISIVQFMFIHKVFLQHPISTFYCMQLQFRVGKFPLKMPHIAVCFLSWLLKKPWFGQVGTENVCIYRMGNPT